MRMADMDFHVVAEISHLDYYNCLLLVSALAYLPTWLKCRGPAEIKSDNVFLLSPAH